MSALSELSHSKTGPAERHFAGEFLDANAFSRARSKIAEVAVDGTNALARPICGKRAVTQG